MTTDVIEKQDVLRETILIDKKIRVEPVFKRHQRSMFPAGHDGEFMYSGCRRGYPLPLDIKRNQLMTILTKEEQSFFEKELDMNPGDLSTYKKKDNFWHKFYVYIDKNGLTLHLSDPIDNLRWRVLKVCPEVAPSWEERNNSAEFIFALVDEDYLINDEVKKSDKLKRAYKFFGSIENSAEKMRNFLVVYGKKPPLNAKMDFLKSEISKIIEFNIDGFLAISEDKNFEMKLFIDNCLEIGALYKEGRTKVALPGGDIIGNTMDETIEFLRNKKNSDIYATLKAKLDQV
jgi:hypothetical protein